MPSSGVGTTQTIQKSDPWAGSQPYLYDLMSRAQQTYNNAQGQTYMPPTYVDPSAMTQQALGMTAQRAANGSPLVNTASNSLSNILTGNSSSAPGSSALGSMLTPGAAPGSPTLTNLTNPNAQANQAASFYSSPQNFNAQFNALSKPVIDTVNAQAGLAGRTGSGAQQQLLTRDLGDLAGSLYSDMANRSLQAGGQLANTQMGAASQLNSDYNTGQTQRLAAASQLNSDYNTGQQQKLAAALQAPNLTAQDYIDLQNLLNVGGAYDQQNQLAQNNVLQQWQYQQQQPWNILSGYAGAVSGLGGLGGSSTGSTTQPSQSALPQLIGTGLSVLPFLL